MSNKRTVGLDRYEHSWETKDKGTASSGVMDWSKVDGVISFYKVKERGNAISIIPYVIKSKNHPLVKLGKKQVGELDYVMDIWEHRNVGAAEIDVVCLKENYGRPCPVCEYVKEARKKGEAEIYDEMKAKRKVYYNILDEADDENRIKVFNFNHAHFEKKLIREAREQGRDGHTLPFAEIEDGYVILFRGEESIKFKNYVEPDRIDFDTRKVKVTDDMVDNAISFDEIMKVLSYEEIYNILHGAYQNEDDQEEVKAQEYEGIEEESNWINFCKYDHVYGADNDKYKDCESCDNWGDCAEMQIEIKKKKRG